MIKILFLLISVIGFSCSPAGQDQPVKISDTVSGIDTTGSLLRVDHSFIDTSLGVYLITSSGAMPEIRKLTGEESKTILKEEIICEPGRKFPVRNCDFLSGWSEEGCFVSKASDFAESRIWEYSDLGAEEKSIVAELAAKVKIKILKTGTGIFYLTRRNGRWQIIFADLRKPCQA